jgi:hypothetical protein
MYWTVTVARQMPRSRSVLAVGCLLLAACSSGHRDATPAIVAADPLSVLSPNAEFALSPGNATGQDEDPNILRAADGKLYLTWYSNRNGRQADGYDDKEIFLMRTSDGQSWTNPPIQLTRSNRYSFYPSLSQDNRGSFHLAWWRVVFTPDGCVPLGTCTGSNNAVMYKSSTNGIDWNLDQETVVAGGPGDMLPSIVHDRRADRLLVFFSSPTRDLNGNVSVSQLVQRLYVSTNSGTGWSAPARLANVNFASTHNVYPQVVQQDDGQFLMTWMRYESAQTNPALAVDPVLALADPTTDIYWARSVDGINWTLPALVSDGDTSLALDVLPSLYFHALRAEWRILWQTARTASSAASGVEIRVGGSFPGDVVNRPEVSGYSGHIVATPTPSIYWSVSVTGAKDLEKIRSRFFQLP